MWSYLLSRESIFSIPITLIQSTTMFNQSSFKSWSPNPSSIPFKSSSTLQQNNVKCSYSWHFPVLNPSVLFPLYLACSCTSIEYTNPYANWPLTNSHFSPFSLSYSKVKHVAFPAVFWRWYVLTGLWHFTLCVVFSLHLSPSVSTLATYSLVNFLYFFRS